MILFFFNPYGTDQMEVGFLDLVGKLNIMGSFKDHDFISFQYYYY